MFDQSTHFNVVILYFSGTIESTGQTTQARSSYLPNEVLWGHRFQPMVMYNKERQGYEVDYSRFNNTDLVDTPLCSARDLERFYQLQQDLGQSSPPDPGDLT
jgi:potassium inwardly-rectifying channel subfamily J